MRQRVSSPEFVGRADELELITTTFAAVTGGAAATFLVAGEAGIGKTRFVAEFRRRAEAGPVMFATGVCVATEGGGLPYAPLVGILRELERQLRDRPCDGEAVAEVRAHLATVLALGSGPGDDRSTDYTPVRPVTDDLAKSQLFEATRECLACVAERQPVVVVFEDVQWADSATAELITFLTRNLDEGGVLLIATYRAEELGDRHRLRPWLGELGRLERVTHVELGELDRTDLAAMIAGILGSRPEVQLADSVWARSRGNAFFAEELVAARDEPSLPSALADVIRARLAALPPEAQQVVRVAAAIGNTIDHHLLAAVVTLDPEALDAAIAEAVDQHVLVVDHVRAGYAFRHGLLREAIHDALLPGERIRFHRHVAVALDRDPTLRSGNRAAELAVHWWAAGEWAAALRHSLVAADAAVASWAFPEALIHLERALAALDRTGPVEAPIVRRDLLMKAADVAYFAAEGRRSVSLAHATVDASDPVADAIGTARAHLLLGRNAWGVGDADLAFGAYRKAAALVPTSPPTIDLVRVLSEEARGLMLMSRTVEAAAQCAIALDAAVALGARLEEAHIRCTLACCRANIGYVDEGIALMREALQIALETQDPDILNRTYANLSHLLLESGHLEESAQLVFTDVDTTQELWGVMLDGATGNSVEAMTRLGRYEQAHEILAQAGNQGVGFCRWGPPMQRAQLAIRVGEYDEGRRQLAIADDLMGGLADVQVRGVYHTYLATAALQQDRPTDAAQEIDRALALAAGTDDHTFRPEMYALGVRSIADGLEQARLHGERVDVVKSRLLALELAQEAQRLVDAIEERGGACTPRVAAFTLMTFAEQSRLDESDPDLWQRVATQWEDAQEPYLAAYARWREGEALLDQRAGRARAATAVRQAWRTAVQLGTRPLRERVEQLAQRARIALDATELDVEAATPSLAADLGLTEREVEVLGQLAAGRTNREIADHLYISIKTVSVHVSNVLRKLEVTNRMQAARIGQAHGL